MSFPDIRYDSAGALADAYFERARAAAASVDSAGIDRAADMLAACHAADRAVYACGNGGSAAIANHLVCDHQKGVGADTGLRPFVVSLSSNIEVITAIANDISYDRIFVHQLEHLARPGDVLITVSASGDSENVVQAAQWGVDNGLGVIAMTGFDGGRSRAIATVSLHVEGDNYGIVEDTHQALMHILAQYLRARHMDEKLIADRKF